MGEAPAGGSGWRYAAAGLGWGVAVGAATGVVVGVVLAVVTSWDAASGGGVEWLGLAVVLPLTGLVYGAAVGGVAGVPGGLVNAVVQPRVRGARAAWWSSGTIATASALCTVLALALWQVGLGVVDPPGGLDRVLEAAALVGWTLPSALLGGWLVARTTRTLRSLRPGEEWVAPPVTRTRVF